MLLPDSKPARVADPRPWVWNLALAVTLGLAFFLRFDGLAEPSLWLDEILHLEQTRSVTMGDTEQHRAAGWGRLIRPTADPENGALFYASQRVALSLFEGEFAVRVVPALAGMGAVVALFVALWRGSRNRWLALAGSVLLAVSPLHVYYAREGRPYAALMLAATLLLLLSVGPRRRTTIAFVYLLCLGSAFLGAVAAPLLISFGVLSAVSRLMPGDVDRRRHRHAVAAAVVSVGLMAFLYPTVQGLNRVTGSETGAGLHSSSLEITRPLSAIALDRLLASLTVTGLESGTTRFASVVLLALALWGAIRWLRTDARTALWVVGLCVLPILVWLAILQIFDHWYNVRYTSVGLPAFLGLVAYGFVDLLERVGQPLRRRTRHRWLSVIAPFTGFVLLLTPNWGAARTEPWRKPDWRGTATVVNTLASQDEIIVAQDAWSATCLGHYLNELRHGVEITNVEFNVDRARTLTRDASAAWVVSAGYLRNASFQTWMQTLNPVLESTQAHLQLRYSKDLFVPLVRAGALHSDATDPTHRHRIATIVSRLGGTPGRQDFGATDLLLGTGWSVAEVEPDGTTFRWASATQAQVGLLAPADTETRALRLRVKPFSMPDTPQTATVSVNGTAIETLALDPGWSERTLPAYRSARAVDLVTFEFDWLRAPREVDPAATDDRLLAVAFDFVELVAHPP